ncbi:MAG: hypothetical protein FK730_06140, partial [Asgard group archaeon]|nr:hypothetical protein [Asgard group archaeon]
MSKNALKFFLVFLLILFLNSSINKSLNTYSLVENNNLPAFDADPFIVIDDDTDFLAFPGYGNESHPYIIEGYNIIAKTTDDIGIYVTGTTKHFEIRNNDISYDNTVGDLGIAIIDVA